jgi:hypothetical protein
MDLAQEALIVGTANVAALFLFQKLLPNSPLLQAFAAGVAIHLTAEYTGVNKAYCWQRHKMWKRKHAWHKKEYESKRGCQLLGTSSPSEVSLLLSPE